MLHNLLLQQFRKHISLSEAEVEAIEYLFVKQEIKPRSYLARERRICAQNIFVTTGCLRGFIIDNNGYEHVLSFAPEGWWIGDMYSLTTGQPGQLYIQALEKTEVYLLSRENQETLFTLLPRMERYFRIILEHSLVAHQQRLMDNMSLQAEARYARFCQKYPMLVGRLAARHIASYIGVTPEFFSKMKNRLLRNQARD